MHFLRRRVGARTAKSQSRGLQLSLSKDRGISYRACVGEIVLEADEVNERNHVVDVLFVPCHSVPSS